MMKKSIEGSYFKIDSFTFLILFMLLFIPQLITYFVGFHNIYVSFITYVFIILAVLNTNLFDELKLKAFKRLFYIIVIPTCIVIGINIIVTLLINDSYNVFKSFLSYLLFLLMEISAIIFYLNLSSIDENIRRNTFIIFSIFYICIGFFTFFVSDYFGLFAKGVSKQMYFFNEPSHYAFLGSSLVIYLFMSLRSYLFIVFFITTTIIAMLWANLTLFLVIMFATFLRILIKNFKFSILIGVFFIVFILAIASGNIPIENPYLKESQIKLYNLFFTPKENISELTVLVYLQGWEYMVSALKQFSFLGLGFQQMGTVFLESESQTRMISRGYNLNIAGGGFNASKIIVEFGFIGILAIFFYLKKTIWFLWVLLKQNSSYQNMSIYNDLILYFSFMTSFLIPLFIRGTSYFNFSFFVLILGFCFIFDRLK
jgi:hypothetical protein